MTKGPMETAEEKERRRCWKCKSFIGPPALIKPGNLAMCAGCGALSIVHLIPLGENGIHVYRQPTIQEMPSSGRDLSSLDWLQNAGRIILKWAKRKRK